MSDPAFRRETPGDAGGFVVGFPSRRDTAAAHAMADAENRHAGFTPRDLIQRIEEAFSRRDAGGPRHFSPEQEDATAGWNPLDPEAPIVATLDPLEEARAAGYAEGLAAAVADDDARDRALLTALIAELKTIRVDREAMARRLRQTVMLLVERLVGETGVSGELLARRIEGAAELLAAANEAAMLRVHPDDVALLEGALPDTIFPVGDAAVARGSFVLESASTVVEDGPALWLEQMASAIDRVALPAC